MEVVLDNVIFKLYCVKIIQCMELNGHVEVLLLQITKLIIIKFTIVPNVDPS